MTVYVKYYLNYIILFQLLNTLSGVLVDVPALFFCLVTKQSSD